MTTVISVANNKGGSAKSTTCTNLAYSLFLLGKKVLLIDGDMQQNLSLSYLTDSKLSDICNANATIYNMLKGETELSDCIHKTAYQNIDVLPSSKDMSDIEYILFERYNRDFVLKAFIDKIKTDNNYDYIIIDVPPTLGGWVKNILMASDRVIIPVEASPWGLYGLNTMFNFIEQAKIQNKSLEILGILLTKVDMRKSYYKQTLEQLNQLESINIFKTSIHLDSQVEWSQESSMPILAYKKSARSGKEYSLLAKEVEECL